MRTSGDLFEQEYETWTPAQAKTFFRAGMVDDFFATSVGDEQWVLTLLVVGRQGQQMQVQLRTARELDPRKVRHFKTLDAAVRAAGDQRGGDRQSRQPARDRSGDGQARRFRPAGQLLRSGGLAATT